MELWRFQVDGVWLSRNFQRPIAVKLCVRSPKVLRCKNVLDVLYHRAKFGGARISPAAGTAKNVEFFSDCLFCLSVTVLNVRVCAPDFFMKAVAWSTETILIPLDRGRFVVVHPCSTFSDCSQLASCNTTKFRCRKYGKIEVFRRQRATE